MILLRMKATLSRLDSLIHIHVPQGEHFNVCGDVHGQYYEYVIFSFLHHLPIPIPIPIPIFFA